MEAPGSYQNKVGTKYDTHDQYMRDEVLKIRTKQKKIKPRGKKDTKKDEDQPEDEPLEEETKNVEEEDASNLIDFGDDENGLQDDKPKSSMIHTKSNNLLDDEDELQQEDDDDLLGDLMGTKDAGKKQNNLIDTEANGSGLDYLSDAFGPSPTIQPKSPSLPQLNIRQVADLDPNNFQQKWMSVNAFPLIQRKVNISMGVNIQNMSDLLASRHIYCIASGNVNEFLKLYLYSQANDGGVFLMELLLNTNSGDMQITMKSDRNDLAEVYVRYVTHSLSPILLN